MAGFMVHMIGDEVRPIVVCTATATARPHSLSAWPSSLSGESQTYVIRWFQLIPPACEDAAHARTTVQPQQHSMRARDRLNR
jgi:hypothetical protein